GLQAEQRSGMVDILEHERGGLIDRRGARAGGRVRLGAGMDRERGKAWRAVGHLRSSCCRDRPVRGTGPWFIEARARVKVGPSPPPLQVARGAWIGSGRRHKSGPRNRSGIWLIRAMHSSRFGYGPAVTVPSLSP